MSAPLLFYKSSSETISPLLVNEPWVVQRLGGVSSRPGQKKKWNKLHSASRSVFPHPVSLVPRQRQTYSRVMWSDAWRSHIRFNQLIHFSSWFHSIDLGKMQAYILISDYSNETHVCLCLVVQIAFLGRVLACFHLVLLAFAFSVSGCQWVQKISGRDGFKSPFKFSLGYNLIMLSMWDIIYLMLIKKIIIKKEINN